MDCYPVSEERLEEAVAYELECIRESKQGLKFNPRLLLAMIKELRELRVEVARWRRCYLDKPEDRLYHASDNTWWSRDDTRWTGIGSLVRADPPPGWVYMEDNMEKIVKEGVISRRWGTAVMEKAHKDPELGDYIEGMPVIPIDLTGKRVRVTIEVLDEPS